MCFFETGLRSFWIWWLNCSDLLWSESSTEYSLWIWFMLKYWISGLYRNRIFSILVLLQWKTDLGLLPGVVHILTYRMLRMVLVLFEVNTRWRFLGFSLCQVCGRFRTYYRQSLYRPWLLHWVFMIYSKLGGVAAWEGMGLAIDIRGILHARISLKLKG